MLRGLVGATESSLAFNKSSTGSSSSGTAVGGISVGDRVVRGPDWNWGEDHDGGSGGYGTVVEVRGAGSHLFRLWWRVYRISRMSGRSSFFLVDRQVWTHHGSW